MTRMGGKYNLFDIREIRGNYLSSVAVSDGYGTNSFYFTLIT